MASVALRFKVLGKKPKEVVEATIDVILIYYPFDKLVNRKMWGQRVMFIEVFITNFSLFAKSLLLQIIITLKIENLCNLQFVEEINFFENMSK